MPAADSWSSASMRFRTCANFWVRRKSSAIATARPAVPGWKLNSAKDVLLTEHDGRVSSRDERPSPVLEALPRAYRVIGRNGRRTRQREFRCSHRSGHVGIRVACDHLALLAQIGSAHHATRSAQTPAAEATAFAFSQSVRFSGLHPLVSED